MDNVFTVAVIGCGAIAENSHFPAFEKLGNVRVKYACDIIKAKAEKMKEKYSFVEKAIEDYREALLDSEVEAVYVLTHNLDHYQMTLEALRAGKHVLCEKPVTVNYDMSLDMKKEADKCKRIGKVENLCRPVQVDTERLDCCKEHNQGRYPYFRHQILHNKTAKVRIIIY